MLKILEQGTAEYADALTALGKRGENDLARVEPAVKSILEAVKSRGDSALKELTERFEKRTLQAVQLDKADWQTRAAQAAPAVVSALEKAAGRIRRYHEHQVDVGFRYSEEGIELGQRVRPLRAVGVYAPGGKARYPSTVLMTAVPAAVAGVERIVLASPNPCAEVLMAAKIAGVTEVIDCGGAQAIAALAYGTESVRAVDKIVGPGNIYVACAKKLVYGTVGIDSIAGPSEILVVADDQANPAIVAADLLSQAEHDEAAYPLLIVESNTFAQKVSAEVQKQLNVLSRKAIAEISVNNNGVVFVVKDKTEAARVANVLASEHLSLCVQNPDVFLDYIEAAGAIFLGEYTPEAAGDYAAGPSHVLPTGGAARYASPLGVYDFVVRTSLIRYSQAAITDQAPLLEELAMLEGLDAHAHAVHIRRK